jgi:hypothetical protein
MKKSSRFVRAGQPTRTTLNCACDAGFIHSRESKVFRVLQFGNPPGIVNEVETNSTQGCRIAGSAVRCRNPIYVLSTVLRPKATTNRKFRRPGATCSGRGHHRGKQLPQSARSGRTLDGFTPTGLGDPLVSCNRFVGTGDHCDPGMRVWMRIRAEWVHAQADAIAGPQDLE